MVCAAVMLLVVFQGHEVAATAPTGSEYNHALASNGATASASGYTSPNTPAQAIDGSSSSVWQSSTTMGSLAVKFRGFANVNVVHAHFTTTTYTSLSLYLDTSGNGFYESGEKVWSTTQNNVLGVVISLQSTYLTLGMQITIDAKVGSTKPQINEFEAYLQGDSDGDGLTNAQETTTTFFQDSRPGGLPVAIPDDQVNASSSSVALAQFAGVPTRALANFTIDHPRKSDLTAAIGYWNGSAWIDRYVWDPGKRLLSVGITQPTPTQSTGGNVSAVATVLAPDITTKVEFRVDGGLRQTVTSSVGNEYRWTWPTSGDATHVMNATQYDDIGARAWDQETIQVNNLGPSVTWRAPADGSTVSGIVYVLVSATDYYGIQSVAFYLDSILQFTDTTPEAGTSDYIWEWDSSGTGLGPHVLKVIALDKSFFPRKSTVTTISVTTANDPTVAITAPQRDAILAETVTVQAEASSGSSTITQVDFLVDGYFRSSDTTSPYAWSWNTASDPNGPHTLTAKSYRASDGRSATASITVYVSNDCNPHCPTGPEPISEPMQAEPASMSLGVLGSDWTPGETDAGSASTIVVDLGTSQSSASAAENASRIFRPGLPLSTFATFLQWRLVVKDWYAPSVFVCGPDPPGPIGPDCWWAQENNPGNITALAIRFEVQSDPQSRDTDGDTIPDGTELNTWSTLPVAPDSDLDGLSDGYEITPHTMTLWTGGLSAILAAFTTNPALGDTDGDGLTDGQERGFVTTGQSKVIGEVGRATGIAGTCASGGVKTVFLRNRYTSAVVIAQPATRNELDTGVMRVKAVGDHTFDVCFQEWSGSSTHGTESVDYLVLEAGNHVLPDGTAVEAGRVSAGTAFATFLLREGFAQPPILLGQVQSYADPDIAAGRIRSVTFTGFDARIRVNSGDTHPAETIGYVAIGPQPDPTVLATWSRGSVLIAAGTNPVTVAFPKAFAAAPRFLAWYATEGSTADLSLRAESLTNASATLWREISGNPAAETLHWFAFADSMNLTARMTTKPSGTGATDTDADGLADGVEVSTHGSNPSLKDTDADGIADNVEATDRTITIPVNGTTKSFIFKTSPSSDDTDADGVKEPDELNGILDHRLWFYDMSTTTDATHLRDLSGNGNIGTMTGTTAGTVKVGGARDFNGVDQKVTATIPRLGGLTTWSFSLWFKWDNSGGSTQHLIAFGQSSDVTVYMAKANRTLLLKATDASGATVRHVVLASFTTTQATQPHFVAVTFDGTSLRAVVDGTATGPWSASAVRIRADGLKIGTSSSETSNWFDGKLDEVQAWDRTLGNAEILGYYNVTNAATGYKARLDFDTRTSSGDLVDFSGTAHSGVATGTTVVEGRVGFARRLAGGTDGIALASASGITVSSSTGATIDVLVQASSMPAQDASLVARVGSFYLNLSSDGAIRWSLHKVGTVTSPLPLPLNRWVRVTATASASTTPTLSLYLDGAFVGSASATSFPSTTNAITIGYTDGQVHLSANLDEFTLHASALSANTIIGLGPAGIVLNPNATDTDFDGLADGQELFVKSVKTPKRYPTRDQLWVSTDKIDLALGAPAWSIKGIDAMVGFTHEDMGQIAARLERWTGTANDLEVYLRTYANAGQSNNFTSYDLLQRPATGSQVARDDITLAGRTWYVKAYDATIGKNGQIEYLQLQVTVHTLPNRADTDIDGLNDSEELNLGSDGYATDPWKADTDADGWLDGYETLTKGTNPLSNDTDGDGARDSSDLDPLRNLLVAVKVRQVHHGASPWCTPELVGIIRINDDYTWVSQHKVANLDSFTSFACPFPPSPPTTQYSTSSFDYTYYADVPDDVSSVSIRATAWAINPGRGDDILVDAFVPGGYALNSGTLAQTLWNGNSWYTFDVWTVGLAKAPTLFVTDGNATITLASGQSRLVGQDRYYVFTFDVTSAYGPFVVGVNTVVVPRSIFLDSKLRTDFDGTDPNRFWPLADATLYGEDLGQAKVSESVAGTIAVSLAGVDAYDVLGRLLRNSTNVQVYSYVDVTSYVVLMNLPADVVRILPWQSVSIGPTGAMPADFWQKIGATASAVVNTLVQYGQMLYDGLVALGTFLVNLAEAIAEWGMKALGAVWEKVQQVAQAAEKVFGQFVDAVVQAILAIWNSIVVPLTKPIVDAYTAWANEVAQLVMSMQKLSVDDFVRGLIQLTFFSAFAFAIFAIIVAFSVAEKITNAMTLGLANVAGIVIGAIAGLIIGMLVVAAINEWLGSTVIEDLLPPGFDEVTGATFTVAQFLFAYELAQRPLKSIRGVETTLKDSILGLMILGVSISIRATFGETVQGLISLVIVDVIALYLALSGLKDMITISGRGANFVRGFYPFLYPVTVAMNAISIATPAADLVSDAGKLNSALAG